MPWKINTKRARKTIKRIRKRKSFAKLPRSVFSLTQPIIPATHKAILRYVDYNNLAITAGALNYKQYIANGLFDPYYTGGGHQPMGFDNWMAMYNHYFVVSSKITIRASQSAAQSSLLCILAEDDATLPYSSVEEMAENRDSSALKLVVPGNEVLVSKSWYAKRAFGRNALSSDSQQGTGAANPSEVSVFTIGGNTVDHASTATVYFAVEIEYHVIFTEPKQFSAN